MNSFSPSTFTPPPGADRLINRMSITRQVRIVFLSVILMSLLTTLSTWLLAETSKLHQINYKQAKLVDAMKDELADLQRLSAGEAQNFHISNLQNVLLEIRNLSVSCTQTFNVAERGFLHLSGYRHILDICSDNVAISNTGLSQIHLYLTGMSNLSRLKVSLSSILFRQSANSTRFEQPVADVVQLIAVIATSTVGIISLILILFISFVGSRFADSLTTMSNAMKRLSTGNLQTPIPDAMGCFELTQMSQNLHVFKLSLIQREHAEKNLRITRFAIDQVMDDYYLLTPEGTVVSVNETTCKHLHMTLLDAVNSNIAIINSNFTTEKWLTLWQNIKTRNTYIMEEVHLDPYGHEHPVEISATHFEYMGQEYGCLFVRDIAERKRQEAELIKHRDNLQQLVEDQTQNIRIAKEVAERESRAKSEFLANMSHELRTPMHAILSYSKFGLKHTKEESQGNLNKYFNNIHTSGQRLLRLLNDLLDLSKLTAGKMKFDMEEINLHRTIYSLAHEVHILALEKEISLELNEPDFETVTMADNDKIKQVIMNLLSNAIKFSPAHGKITVNFYHHDYLTDRNDMISGIAVEITDEGPGVPESELESIFDQFIQSSKTKTGAGGTGLGLAICKEIIEGHQGKIWAKNNNTQGAVFTFVLPYIRQEDMTLRNRSNNNTITADESQIAH